MGQGQDWGDPQRPPQWQGRQREWPGSPYGQQQGQGAAQWQDRQGQQPQWGGAVPPDYDYAPRGPVTGYRPQTDPEWAPREDAPPPQRTGYGLLVTITGWSMVVIIAVLAGTVVYLTHRVSVLEAAARPSPSAAAASTAPRAPVEAETKAGVRAAANAFYDLYAASQWAQAWTYLAPATQRAVSAKTWTDVHEQCTDHTAGLARTIKGVTMSGSTAVVDETVAGALGKLGTVSDAWVYSGGKWGLKLPASSMAVYKHGSVKADVAAAKAAGECAS